MTKKKTYQSYDWPVLRKAWSLTPPTITQKDFAEKHNVNVRTLQARMRKDASEGWAWERDLSDTVRQKTKTMQQRIAAGLDKDTPITEESMAVATAAATNLLVLQTQEDAFGKAMDVITTGFDMLKGQIQQGYLLVEKRKRGEISIEREDVSPEMIGRAANGLTNALERVTKLQRHHLGMDDDNSDVSYEDDLKALADSLEDDSPGDE